MNEMSKIMHEDNILVNNQRVYLMSLQSIQRVMGADKKVEMSYDISSGANWHSIG